MKTKIIFALLFISLNIKCSDHSTINFYSTYQNDKLLRIVLINEIPYIARYDIYNDEEYTDQTFGDNGSSEIPLKGNAADFKIYLLDSKNILISNTVLNHMVIFNENGLLLKKVKDVKKMIKEKQDQQAAARAQQEAANIEDKQKPD